MTENIPQTSASERLEAAQKALAQYDRNESWYEGLDESYKGGKSYEYFEDDKLAAADNLAAALRALITPPAVGESEEQIALRVLSEWGMDAQYPNLEMAVQAVREAIQSAHKSWEPADVPTQEFMLRHLGIEYVEHHINKADWFEIEAQSIEKEVI